MSETASTAWCKDCEPVILDVTTRKPLPEDHPEMQTVLEVWKKTTPEEREAMHEVTCNHRQDPKFMLVVVGLWRRMGDAVRQAARNA